MELDLAGKVAIVTGGSQGIGRAITLAFVAEGVDVAVCARSAEPLEETRLLAEKIGRGRVITVQADLTVDGAGEPVVAACLDELGGLDILVNNAGSARHGPFLETPEQNWQEDFALKYFGYLRMSQAAMRHMEAQGSGVVCNIAGSGAFVARRDYLSGGGANAALNHFTRVLADEGVDHGIRAVCVNPGGVLTEKLQRFLEYDEGKSTTASPMGRFAEPEEIANLVLYLVSPRAAYITGQSVTIDGGAVGLAGSRS
jgi:NAD(P)-dependent dehydrogenase (short-subunit alcohol dehydrogenase family)